MCAPSSFTNWSLDGSVKHTVRQMVSEPGHRFKSLESHCEGGIVRDFTIRSNTNGLGLRSNAIKNVCPLILHQLVVGWIGKAHGPTSGIRAKVIGLNRWSRIVRDFTICSNTNGLGLRSNAIKDLCPLILH